MKPQLTQSPVTRANAVCTLLTLMALSASGCASVYFDAPDGPAQTAQTYVGQPLAKLEAELGPPQGQRARANETVSTWDFDHCAVTARSNADGIVTDVSWSRGCAVL